MTSPSNPLSRRAMLGGAAALAAAAVPGTAVAQNARRGTPAPRRFDGKVVAITGATSGIGRQTAIRFAEQGANVVFCGRRENLGREVQQEIRGSGGNATFVRADVRDAEQVRRFVDEAARRHGRLDIAFNNAGVIGNQPLHETDEEEFDRVINTNLKGVWLAMRYEIPHILRAGGGAIINTASMHAFATRPRMSPYAASKAGLLGIINAAAQEYGPQGIRINGVAPGAIDTPMLRAGIGSTAEGRQRFADGAASLKRVGEADEIAQAVLWLASPESSYVAGTMLRVDGGTVSAL